MAGTAGAFGFGAVTDFLGLLRDCSIGWLRGSSKGSKGFQTCNSKSRVTSKDALVKGLLLVVVQCFR